MILMAPQIIDAVKKAIGAPGIGEVAGGIGAPLGVGVKVPLEGISRLAGGYKERRKKAKEEALLEEERRWRGDILKKL